MTRSTVSIRFYVAVSGAALAACSSPASGGGTISSSGTTSGSGITTGSGAPGGTSGAGGSATGASTTGQNSGSGVGTSGADASGSASGAPSTSGSGASGAGGSGSLDGGMGSGGSTVGSSGVMAGGGPPTGPFTCTTILGLLTTGEWFNAGFTTDLGPALAKQWQGRFVHYGYVYVWADPMGKTRLGDAVWSSPITNACAQNSAAPDRVVYQAWSWELTTQAAWVTPLEASIVTIQAKYPSVKRIDLMTIIRCPMNGWCRASMPPLGPNTDGNALQQDCHVPDYVDAAFAQVAANHPTLVAVVPRMPAAPTPTGYFETPHCSAAVDGIHLHEQNPAVASQIADWFKTNP